MSSVQTVIGPGEVLRASDGEVVCPGIGSGVVVLALDHATGQFALGHFVLPRAPREHPAFAPKCVEEGLALLLSGFCSRSTLCAAVVGGAQLYRPDLGGSSHYEIGARNSVAAQESLLRAGVPVPLMDVGGQFGRSVRWDPDSGVVYVRSLVHGEARLGHLGADSCL